MRDERKSFVIMEGGTVRVVEERVKKVISYKDFIDSLSHNMPHSTDILPPGTIYEEKRDKHSVVVVEIPPRIQTMKFVHNEIFPDQPKVRNGVYKYKLAMPYMYYFVKILASMAVESVGVAVTKKPINSFDDMVYSPPIPNLFNVTMVGNFFCIGDI